MKEAEMILAFQMALDKLGVKHKSPVTVELKYHGPVKFGLLIEHFGNVHGTVLGTTADAHYMDELADANYNAMLINPVFIHHILDMLKPQLLGTAKYYGPIADRPSWHTGPVMSKGGQDVN